MPVKATSSRNALEAAARIIAAGARAAAGTFSKEIPAAIKTYMGAGLYTAFVAAGSPGGKWGWTPIHAWMFEQPHEGRIPKHPLFGYRGRWYFQPYRPFMEEAAETFAQQACNEYADVSIAKWCAELGYK
jgi:hypothetical protein